MMVSENIVNAWRSREGFRNAEGQPDWAEWARKNDNLAAILAIAEQAENGK